MPDDLSLSLKVCESDVLVTKAREDGHLSPSKENKSDVSLPYFYGWDLGLYPQWIEQFSATIFRAELVT